MLELKSKRKLFFQRNKNMIENVQSPLCLKLLTISSPKNRFFIKPNRELELVREQSLTCAEQRAPALQLRPLAGWAPPQHPRFSDLSFLLLLLGWLDSFSFNALLSSPPASHYYHGPHASLPQSSLCSSSWQSDPKGNSPRPRSTARKCIIFPMVWYTALYQTISFR